MTLQMACVVLALAAGLVSQARAISQFSDSWTYPINGHEPDGTGPFPLFIYLQGTLMDQNGPNTEAFTSYMADNGVVGAAVHYFNGYNITDEECGGCYPLLCDEWLTKAQELFSTTDDSSAVSVLCAREDVDCSLGIVIAGYSQGAQLASLSVNFVTDYDIHGVYEMAGGDFPFLFYDFTDCLSFDALSWSESQIRAITGSHDEIFGITVDGVREQLISITGRSCDNTTLNCIQENGSGWYIVEDSEAGNASHCYAFDGPSACTAGVLTSEYYGGCGTDCEWSLEANMDWLLSKLDLDDGTQDNGSGARHQDTIVVGAMIFVVVAMWQANMGFIPGVVTAIVVVTPFIGCIQRLV